MKKTSSVVLPIEKKTRYSKLERLLAQPDIFDTLRKIGNGSIKSYEDLDINAASKNIPKSSACGNVRLQRSGTTIGGKIDKKDIDEFENQNEDFKILKLEK